MYKYTLARGRKKGSFAPAFRPSSRARFCFPVRLLPPLEERIEEATESGSSHGWLRSQVSSFAHIFFFVSFLLFFLLSVSCFWPIASDRRF
jgi:hypothetical protein